MTIAMESLACSVLEKYRERLKGSGVDPFRFACKLLVAEIVTDADVLKAGDKDLSAGERWSDLVTAIMRSSTEDILKKFSDVLLEERELQHLGSEMKGTLRIVHDRGLDAGKIII